MKKLLLVFGTILLMMLISVTYVMNRCQKPELKDKIAAREYCLAWLMESKSASDLAKQYCEEKQRSPCYINSDETVDLVSFINKVYDKCVDKELEDNGFCKEER